MINDVMESDRNEAIKPTRKANNGEAFIGNKAVAPRPPSMSSRRHPTGGGTLGLFQRILIRPRRHDIIIPAGIHKKKEK